MQALHSSLEMPFQSDYHSTFPAKRRKKDLLEVCRVDLQSTDEEEEGGHQPHDDGTSNEHESY